MLIATWFAIPAPTGLPSPSSARMASCCRLGLPARISKYQIRTLESFDAIRQTMENLTRCRTIFQTADVWPMKDNADPLCGWPAEEVAQTLSGAATADIYGKLFYYLRSLFRTFLARVSNSKVSFQLFQVDAADLPDYLSGESFSRIEASISTKF